MVQGTGQDLISWQSCLLWAVRPGNNNTYLTGVNGGIETDDGWEGFRRPECCNKCASSAFQATAALGGKAGHTHRPPLASAGSVGAPALITRFLGYSGCPRRAPLDSCICGLLFMFFISASLLTPVISAARHSWGKRGCIFCPCDAVRATSSSSPQKVISFESGPGAGQPSQPCLSPISPMTILSLKKKMPHSGYQFIKKHPTNLVI